MQPSIRVLVLVFLLAGAVLPGTAVRGAPPSVRAEDPLARRVTFETRGEPLEDLLLRLGQRAPVRLVAPAHLRERRMSLLVRDEPLRHVLDRIAAVWSLPRYPARWLREKDKGVYHLHQHPDAAREGALREAEDRRVLREHVAGLMEVEYQDKLPGPNTDLRNVLIPDVDPRALADPDYIPMDPRVGKWPVLWGAAVGGMLRELPPELRERALRGEEVAVPSTSLSARTQDLLFLIATLSRTSRRKPGVPTGQADFSDIQWETAEERRQRFAGETVAFVLTRSVEQGQWSPSLRMRDPRTGNHTGGRGPGGTPIGFSEALESKPGGGTPPASARRPRSEPFPEREKDRTVTPLTPEQRKALAEAGKKPPEHLTEIQALLHRVLRRPVLADHYTRVAWKGYTRSAFSGALKHTETLEGFLDALTRPLQYRWRRHGTALLFRSRLWWLEDEREIPLSLVRRLQKARKERGYLELAELADCAQLTQEQLQNLETEYLPLETVQGMRSRQEWLRLYQVLGPTLRARIEGSRGLALAELPPEAAALLAASDSRVVRELRSLPPERLAEVRVRLFQERSRLPGMDREVVRTRLVRTAPEPLGIMDESWDQVVESGVRE